MNAAALVHAIFTAALLVVFWSAAPTSAFGQQPRVELELATEPGFPTELARTWIETLNKAGIEGVRIRGGNVADELRLEPTGTPQAPGYRVTGILTMDGTLLLPGGKFTSRDVAGLSRWLAKLQEGGSEGLTAKPAAFGLLPSQLVATHEALAAKVSFSTKGVAPRDVVEKLAKVISLETRIEASALAALEECDPIGDELQGLSQGTALAAAVRPAGLIVVPTKTAGKVELLITSSTKAKDGWPVGWPNERPPKEVLPDLMKFIAVEINDTPLGEALSAIAGRLKVPVVIDYNALARKKVDLAETKVKLPKMRTFYAKILDRMLFPVGLKYELRLDEADQPFLWITALGR